MINPSKAAPMGKNHRVSSDSSWPLRNAEGLTFAEAKRRKIAAMKTLAERSKEQSNG